MPVDLTLPTALPDNEFRAFVHLPPTWDDVPADLSVESQAALRQFGFARCTGYGVDPADALELRARVVGGQGWSQAATDLAERCLATVRVAPADGGDPTRVGHLRRASALLRISQVMMLTDTHERRRVYAEAVDLYAQAAALAGDRMRLRVETPEGTLCGWVVPARGESVGAALVVGGVEGWAMDFDSVGEALAARGVDAYLLDAPGQGESRLAEGVYLTHGWLAAYGAVLDEIERRCGAVPLAVIGHSMGGSFALALAAADQRVTACCDNGGIPVPAIVPPEVGTFFTKMAAFCGLEDAAATTAVWSAVQPLAPGPNAGFPLLVLHGGHDPLVSEQMLDELVAGVPTRDTQVVVFSDGTHCLYNHRHDRDALIGDWVRARLRSASSR